MSANAVLEQVKQLDNDTIIAFLGQMEIGTYIHNPWFIGCMAVLAIACLIFKWRVLLATIVGLTGLAWLVSYTSEQGTEVTDSLQSNSMIYFVIGAVLIIAIMLYIVFIKEE